MQRIPMPGGWYSFATLQGDWGTLFANSHIESSRGRIELPVFNGVPDNVLFLSGATEVTTGSLIMGGQSNGGNGAMLYGLDKQWHSVGVAFGIQMVCFSQDGRFFYCVSSGNTGFWIDMLTGQREDFIIEFGVNGIRAIIPPSNKMIVGIQTIYSPQYQMNEYVDFGNDFVCGQIAQGYGAVRSNKRYLIREGDCFANKVMFDGFNIAYGTTDRIARMGEIIFTDVNELREINPIIITPINRPHWLGFFTGKPGVAGGWDTNDDPPEFQDTHALPGNGYLDVPTSTFYDDNDRPIGSFIHSQPGWTVETMEEAAKHTQFPPICYWDARKWPRWPTLPANSWLCLQAYCGKNESFTQFEASLHMLLSELENLLPQQKVALVDQSFWQTPVNGLTDDLAGLIPIFSRLAANFPNVIATIPFNGNGRFNGMQHHPEIRPIWQQLANTITGEPNVANPQLPQEVCDAVIRERGKYGPVPTRPELAQILNDAAWSVGQGADWGLSRKDQGFNVSSPDRPGLGNIASDILHRKSDNMIWDVLVAAGEAATPNCGEALGPMGDPNRPWVAPVQPPDVPEPEQVSVTIFEHDPVFKRSDPFGGLIKYEISSARPIVKAEYFCEGNGEPPITIDFPVTPGFDGRYIRQIGVKFTINGTWTLKVRGYNDQGQVGESDGSHQINVTF
jgi:hypothetical protein